MAPPRGHVYFRRGFLAAITNPKTIAFFTAFLPQFVDPALPAGHQVVVMCAVAIAMATLTDCAWGVVAGAGRSFFLQRVSTKWLGRLSGTVLIGGGIWLSLARRPG
jgi:threonine/homoserine/homoserine lactone efflux protein